MTILNTIVESKRLQFSQFGTEVKPLESGRTSPSSKGNAFFKSLNNDKISIIGEVKPKSPSAGQLLDQSRLPEIMNLYKTHCTAVSVLTDEEFFGGSFELLERVKSATQLPVLCKDFIVSSRQISLAQQHGADAILLIAKILTRAELSYLLSAAENAGLCPVVEINNFTELDSIAGLPIDVILINNRNLDSMLIDLDTTRKLASGLSSDKVIISASGIKSNQDVLKLLPYSRRFLIGTSLMRSEDPATLLSQLNSNGETISNQRKVFNAVGNEELGRTEFNGDMRNNAIRGIKLRSEAKRMAPEKREFEKPIIKICGITSSTDADLAIQAGAEFLGLIFATRSARKVSIENTLPVIASIKRRAKIVGVFQNQELTEVNAIAQELDLDLIQLHGEEDAAYANACIRPVIKAFNYSAAMRLEELREFYTVQYFLFDLDKTTANCSTSIDRFQHLSNALAPVRHQIPPFFLAGKLSTDNVREALRIVRPHGIDVASGVEESVGKKSAPLIDQFCRLVHSKQNPLAPQVVNR